MDQFLIHCSILAWASLGAARQLGARLADRLLIAALLAWGNIVGTSLLLSALHRLDEPGWFLGASTVLAAGSCLACSRLRAAPPVDAGRGPDPWLVAGFMITLLPVALANAGIIFTYEPNSAASLTHGLPRVMYYLGQGSLAHFDTSDSCQVSLPFNFQLLQLLALLYGAPLQCLTLFNLAAWTLTGLGIYRLCRLCAVGANAALITCWLVLMTMPVLAQSTATTLDLPVGAGLVTTAIFALQWGQTRRPRTAVLAGLAAGLTAGTSLGALFFILAAGLVALWWNHRDRRRGAPGNIRAWLAPVVLAGAVALPFALFNALAHGKPERPAPAAISDQPAHAATPASEVWTGFHPLWRKPSSLSLNEETVGYGPTGLLFLLCALPFLGRRSALTPASGWCAWLGLGWLAAGYFVGHWILPEGRASLPALLLVAPCFGAAIEAGWTSVTVRRYAVAGTLLLLVIAAEWSAGIYLLHCTSRPLAPLLNAALVPPALPTLPLLLDHRLSHQPRINVDTDGVNERIFPLMTRGSGRQWFTSWAELDPVAYNLLSRSSASRTAAFRQLTQLPAYVLVPLVSKHSAGVEFLATLGRGVAARDYLGIEPHPGHLPSISSNRNLLVTLSQGPGQSVRPAPVLLKLAGLNPEDQVRLAVDLKYADGHIAPLLTISANGETVLPPTPPFQSIVFRAVALGDGTELGSAMIPYEPRPEAETTPIDPALPTSARSLFVIDAVLSRDLQGIKTEGLLPTEGPFPQWDLPYIRWATRPLTRLRLPPVAGLARLQLSFSVRLHVRPKAELDVLFNGRLVQRYRLEDQSSWLDQTLDLIPQLGENVIEFRDVPLRNEPDWADYLARYSDVKEWLLAQRVPLEQGAQQHYELNGRAEGRTVRFSDPPSPASDSYYFMFRNLRLEGFRSP